jgi:hypothetical protein
MSLADLNTYLLFVFFLLTNAKFFAFCSLSSDDEDPKRDAATASHVDTLAVSCLFPWFLIRLSFPCSVLQML